MCGRCLLLAAGMALSLSGALAHDRRLDVFEGRSQYIDLGAAHYAWTVSSVMAVLRGRLKPETVARLKGELQRRVFDIYIDQMRHPEKRRLGWYYDRANWNAVCNGNTILSALAVIEDRRLRAEFVESGERTAPKYLAGFTSDGYCSEGVGYWDYGFSNYLRFALAVRQLTGGRLDFFRDPKWRAVVEYGYGIQLQPGRAPQFADGEGQPSTENMALGRLAYPDLVPPRRPRPRRVRGAGPVRGSGRDVHGRRRRLRAGRLCVSVGRPREGAGREGDGFGRRVADRHRADGKSHAAFAEAAGRAVRRAGDRRRSGVDL